MSRSSTLILFGVLVTISPFVGLPMAVLAWVLPVLGLGIIALGVTARPRTEENAAPVHEKPLAF